MIIKKYNEITNKSIDIDYDFIYDILDSYKIELDESGIKNNISTNITRNHIEVTLTIISKKLNSENSKILAYIIDRLSNREFFNISIDSNLKLNLSISNRFQIEYLCNYILDEISDTYTNDTNLVNFINKIDKDHILRLINDYLISLSYINIKIDKLRGDKYIIKVFNNIQIAKFILNDHKLLFI